MKSWLIRTVVLVVWFAAPLATFAAEPELDPLLELLVEQGVITLEQARGVQAEYDRRAASQAEASSPGAVTPADLPAAELPAPEPVPAALEVSLPAAGEALDGVKNLKVGGLAYLSYQDGNLSDGSDYSQFRVKRAYIDIRKKLTDSFSVRMTPDVVQKPDGDLELRFKYLYGQFNFKDIGPLRGPYVEFGVAHMPWLDFEEHINRFRMQDTMFMERNGLFNSADTGILFGANLGSELDAEYRERVNDHYAGRWGSFGIGVYNGGGYHAVENNDGKAIEGRLSLRPIPAVVPGLQLSVFGVSGSGNAPDGSGQRIPDWEVLAGMVSYESPRLVLTAQYERGTGNQKGNAIGPDGDGLPNDGYSFFSELRLDREQTFSLIGRYDRFDVNRDDPANDVATRWIAGFAWRFFKGNYWLLDLDRLAHSAAGLDTENRVQLTLQIKY